MSRQSGPGARGYLRTRPWKKLPTGSTTKVLSICWTDLVGCLRVWVYMGHLEKRGSRENLLDRLHVQAQLLEISMLHTYLYFSHNQAFILISQRIGQSHMCHLCSCVSACINLCGRTDIFIYTHVLYTHTCASAYWQYIPASSQVRAGLLKLCLFGDFRSGNRYKPLLTF